MKALHQAALFRPEQMKPSPPFFVIGLFQWHLYLMVNKRERKDGWKDRDVYMTQLGPALSFTTPEILWRMSEPAEHTSKPQASYYTEG